MRTCNTDFWHTHQVWMSNRFHIIPSVDVKLLGYSTGVPCFIINNILKIFCTLYEYNVCTKIHPCVDFLVFLFARETVSVIYGFILQNISLGILHLGVLVCGSWSVGLLVLVCWSVGLGVLVCWSVGLGVLVCWSWCVGLLVLVEVMSYLI